MLLATDEKAKTVPFAFFAKAVYSFQRFFSSERKKRRMNMKTKFGKLLHLLGLDVLLLGLFEKLALELIKKLTEWIYSLQRSLIRVDEYRNELLNTAE